MVDIELVIKIPEEIYNDTKTHPLFQSDIPAIEKAIKNGTPLPKGHGELIDLQEMIDKFWDGNYMEIHKDDLPNINKVVKADRGK